MRNEAQHACLQEHAHRVMFLELQGSLFFGTSEQLLRGVRSRLQTEHLHLLLDMRRVLELDDAGCETLERLQAEMLRRGGSLVLSSCSERLQWRSPQEVRELCAAMKQPVCRSLDEALECAEDRVVAQFGSEQARAEVCEIGPEGPAAQLLSGLSAMQRSVFMQAMERCEFEAGSLIFRKDEPGDSLYLVVCGRVDIWLNHGQADAVRLASFRQGVTFGEMGLLRDKPRTADAVAVNDVVALKLSREGLQALQRDNPMVLVGILAAISQELSSRLGKTNRALRAALQL
jgi:SulP family sulfate permease